MAVNVHSVTAPIGGWNKRDPLASMGDTDAVILDNFFCQPTELELRGGYADHVTGITGDVETLMDYESASGTSELFAAADNSGTCAIYDVTTAGTVGAAVVSGLTSARFRHSHINTVGGSFAHFVNGADNLQLYDGTTWYTVTDVSATYSITGVDTATLDDVALHMRRMWFVEQNSMSAWYLATDAISGAATEFNIGAVFHRGGKLAKLATLTIDAGYGMDDHLAFISSEGEVALYRGTNPASASTWSLVGVYFIGAPIGINFTRKFGGDVIVITRSGPVSLTGAMQTKDKNNSALTDKINQQVASDTANYGSQYGWDVIAFPQKNVLFLNVPISSTVSYQYVMNTITGAWSRFTGWNAKCWYVLNNELYFGGAGTVYKAWTGTSDNGSDIVTDVLPAFNNFGTQSQIKRIAMARIILGYDSAVGVVADINIDFDMATPVSTPTFSPSVYGTWDSGVWDSAIWGGDLVVARDWQSVFGIGYWASLHFKTSSSNANISVYSLDYTVEKGGVL